MPAPLFSGAEDSIEVLAEEALLLSEEHLGEKPVEDGVLTDAILAVDSEE